jgi:two-component system response regulator FixJ
MPGERLEITIVDDDAAVRDLLEMIFELEGFAVQTYADGDRFLADAKRIRTDCVILDVCMPRRSGLEILEAIGGSDYPAPILIISGRGDIPMAVSAIKAGAHDFIKKPFDADTVIARVREAVAARRQRETENTWKCGKATLQ